MDKPKGIEVVKQGIQKLKFNQQLKKSEGAKEAKPPKVELTISVEGVSIQEPKTKKVLHQVQSLMQLFLWHVTFCRLVHDKMHD